MAFIPSSSLVRRARLIGHTLLAAFIASTCSVAVADDAKGPLLSLGDSVVFGFIEENGYAYVNPDNFLGYPEIAGGALHLATVNPSCPGETTASFLSVTGPDNGCRSYRANFPLHVKYGGTQMEFARSYLGAHRDTRLVTLSLGANDGFLLQDACKGDLACVKAGLPAALAAVYGNLNTILGNLRASGLRGVLMVVNYYSLDYSDPVQTELTVALNSTLASAAAANGAIVADAFTAFQKAAANPWAAGNTCKAGLLNGGSSGPGTCDVHPSLTGQRLLAKTVQEAYRSARRVDD